MWAWDGYGHSKSLVQGKKEGEEHSIIVSRSHAGEIESIAKDSFGENVKIIPAGGAGTYVIAFLLFVCLLSFSRKYTYLRIIS